MKSRPTESEFAKSFSGYVALVPETDALAVLEHQLTDLAQLAQRVPTDREKHRYADGKWSVREVLGHLIDSERVFAYRGFCISRGEQVSLPGFEENDYVAESHYADQSLPDLVSELSLLRRANVMFFRGLSESDWERRGTANENAISVRAIAFIMAGHMRHHFVVLRDRYGIGSGG
jgi:hypothetical protein